MADAALEVRESNLPNAGNGLFAKRRFQCGEIICEYRGKVLAMKEALQLPDKSYLMRLGKGVYVDALDCLDVHARYINDCRSQGVHNVEFDKIPELGKANVRAIVDIQEGDELYADYGKLYWLAYNLQHPNNQIK